MPKSSWQPTTEENLMVIYYSTLVRELTPQMKVELAEYLGISYFTLMSKVSEVRRGKLTRNQFTAITQWFKELFPETTNAA